MQTDKKISKSDPLVNILLQGGRVTSTFREAVFDAAQRSGMSANELVLMACADRLRQSGSEFSGVFRPGDVHASLFVSTPQER